MLNKEELKVLVPNAEDKEIDALFTTIQEKGDKVKEKYENLATELDKKFNALETTNKELTKKLEDTSKDNDKDINKNDDKDSVNAKLLAKIEQLEATVSNITTQKTTEDVKSNLLSQVSEKGYNVEHATALFNTLGTNLSDKLEDYEALLVKVEPGANKDLPDDKDEKDPVFISTGDEEIDAILKEE